jgi:hypothetical protein
MFGSGVDEKDAIHSHRKRDVRTGTHQHEHVSLDRNHVDRAEAKASGSLRAGITILLGIAASHAKSSQ